MKKLLASLMMGLILACGAIGISAKTVSNEKNFVSPTKQNAKNENEKTSPQNDEKASPQNDETSSS